MTTGGRSKKRKRTGKNQEGRRDGAREREREREKEREREREMVSDITVLSLSFSLSQFCHVIIRHYIPGETQ